MATQAPAHGPITDRQGRLSLTLIDDRTLNTTSTTTTSPFTAVSRLDSADWDNTTKVDQVIEIGTNGIVGGVVNLGSYKGKLMRQTTSTKLIGLVTGQKQSATVGATTTWNYFSFSTAQFDYARLLADPAGKVFAAWIALDAILSKVGWDIKSSGNAMEEFDVMGPQLTYINGYPVSKAYVVQAADVTAGYVPLSSTFFGALNAATSGAEIPNRVLPPVTGAPPNSLYTDGRVNFLKVARLLSATETIGGFSYSAGSIIRVNENQDYKITASSLGTAGAQASVTLTVPGFGNYAGPELVVGSNLIVDIGGASQEICAITAINYTTNVVSFTTTHTHATTGITVGLQPVSGQCIYNPLNGAMVFGDALIATDVIRVIMASYDTSSVSKQLSTTSFDSVDVPGVPGRLIPVTLAAYGIPRLSSLTIDVSIPRKEVQGVGENHVIYGTAGVPDIKYSLSVMPIDNSLLEQMSSGTTGNGTNGDIYPADYVARYMTANPMPLTATIKHPVYNSKTIYSVTGGNPVFDSQGESGNANGEMTQKYSGTDMTGTITVTAVT